MYVVKQGRREPVPNLDSLYVSLYFAISFRMCMKMGSGDSGEFIQQHLAPGFLIAAQGVLSSDTLA